MEITPPAHTLTFTGVLSESLRIIKSYHFNFLTFALYFLPLSTTLIVTPTLRHLPYHHHSPLNHHPNFPPNHPPYFPPNHHDNNNYPSIHDLVWILMIYTFTLGAISTITSNAHHIFSLSNPPITNLLTMLTNMANSFFPLTFTAVVSHALMFLASLVFLMLVGLAFMSVQTLAVLFRFRFVVEYDSVYSVVLGVVLFVFMMWLYVNWLLVNVVVVTESKWGFQALVRSWYLVKGMRLVAVKLFLFYGVLEGFLVLVYSRSLIGYGVESWAFILNVVFGSGFLMLLMLQSCVAKVVLYNYCKAIHGELVIDVGGDYVGLSADDEKVPYVVTVVTA